MRRSITSGALALALTACSSEPPAEEPGSPLVEVTAAGETEPVGTNNEDAADDAAIWRNPADPAASLIVATDKKAGLYLYGLDGKVRDFEADGRLNNVDMVDLGTEGVIAVASDRNDEANAKLRFYRLDTEAAQLVPLGTLPGGAGEGYGVCAMAESGRLRVASVVKGGTITERRVRIEGDKLTQESATYPARTLPSQSEGCVYDPRSATLYTGEEDSGIWRFTDGAAEGELIAKADGAMLVPDVEGLALVPVGADGGYLIASSQGDNAYAVFALPGVTPAGRFKIAAGKFGSTEETDGIALSIGDFGPLYPTGLFIAQDGENGTLAQNFKLVSWQEIEEALKGWKPPAK
jgi:3-phytase